MIAWHTNATARCTCGQEQMHHIQATAVQQARETAQYHHATQARGRPPESSPTLTPSLSRRLFASRPRRPHLAHCLNRGRHRLCRPQIRPNRPLTQPVPPRSTDNRRVRQPNTTRRQRQLVQKPPLAAVPSSHITALPTSSPGPGCAPRTPPAVEAGDRRRAWCGRRPSRAVAEREAHRHHRRWAGPRKELSRVRI